jgi:hypothetical protein
MERSAVWYCATVALPLNERTLVPAFQLPVMPAWFVKAKTSWPLV